MINGPSYYQHKLPRRPATGGHGQQEKFVGLGSFLAFFSARVLRGGPKALVQLTACFAAMVLLTKLLAGGRNYGRGGGWSWQKAGSGVDDDDDGSVAGGLRIVVFGESDVATPAHLQLNAESRSWTEILCDELNCTSYLSFVPSSSDPSRVMTSTELYATSVDRALNLTGESHGPGLDYNFMLNQFPIDWDMTDLSRQIDAFLAMEKPRHSPAETLWVFSLGMWDVWSLASEPLAVSKNIVDALVDHIFLQVERLYTSAADESSIAWSEPVNTTSSSSVETGLPTPTPDPETMRVKLEEERELASKREPDETKHFRILVPRLFDPSLTPGWHDRGRDIPEVHSKAEQMRNAAVLTNRWNNRLYAATAQWIRTETHRETLELASRGDGEGRGAGELAPLEILNGRVSMKELEARAKILRMGLGGQNHLLPPPAPPQQVRRSDVEGEVKEEGHEAGEEEEEDVEDTEPPPAQRDGILYDINKYLEEVIVDRQLRNSGLRDARSTGMLTERGFKEVWKPCVSKPEEEEEEEDVRERDEADGAGVLEEAEANSPEEGGVAYERKRDVAPEPAIRGRAAVPVAAESTAPLAEGMAARVCEDPDEHLFYTPLTVSPRAVAAIARQAADMVRRNETLRSGWATRHVPPLKYVGG